ncbi:hypothetical protein SCB49_06137 [unidentified eubacterium SCB49]|nr:hypothetical protein SCB49_06137 [unidentified eubacterium SCB49]
MANKQENMIAFFILELSTTGKNNTNNNSEDPSFLIKEASIEKSWATKVIAKIAVTKIVKTTNIRFLIRFKTSLLITKGNKAIKTTNKILGTAVAYLSKTREIQKKIQTKGYTLLTNSLIKLYFK